MANDSKNYKEVQVVRVPIEEVQKHLLKIGCNIDFGGTSFFEPDNVKQLKVSTSNNSTSTTGGNSGGAQPSKTEFVAAGLANICEMLPASQIVTIETYEKGEKEELAEIMKKEDAEADKYAKTQQAKGRDEKE